MHNSRSQYLSETIENLNGCYESLWSKMERERKEDVVLGLKMENCGSFSMEKNV